SIAVERKVLLNLQEWAKRQPDLIKNLEAEYQRLEHQEPDPENPRFNFNQQGKIFFYLVFFSEAPEKLKSVKDYFQSQTNPENAFELYREIVLYLGSSGDLSQKDQKLLDLGLSVLKQEVL